MVTIKNQLLRMARYFIILAIFTMQVFIVHSAGDYAVKGKIIGETGTPISGAKVEVYLVTKIFTGDVIGQYLTSVFTNATGIFTVKLDLNQYILKLSSPGYVSKTLNLSLSNSLSFAVSLGEISLVKSVSLSSYSSSVIVHDGQVLKLPFQLSNQGDGEWVNIGLSTIGNYTYRVLNQQGQNIQGIYVPSGGSVPFTLEVEAPMVAKNTSTIITLSGLASTSYPLSLRVGKDEGSLLTCSYQSRVVTLGRSFDFAVTITNPTYHDATLGLTLTSPNGWIVSTVNLVGEGIKSVTLAAGASVDVHVKGSMPLTESVGSFNISMKAFSGSLTDELDLVVSVGEDTQPIKITSLYPSQSIQLGNKATYPITIQNPGTEQLFQLNVVGVPSGWDVTFSTTDASAKQINALKIDSGSFSTINVAVTPALNSTRGTYRFTVKAVGESKQGTIDLSAEVSGSFQVSIASSSLYFQTQVGKTETITVIVTNKGYSAINDLGLQVAVPSNWVYSVSPLKVTTLAPNEKASFLLTITNPTGTAPQDYLVSLQGVSSQLSTDTLTVRFTVNVESNWTIYGIVLLFLAIGGFALMYRRLRRR